MLRAITSGLVPCTQPSEFTLNTSIYEKNEDAWSLIKEKIYEEPLLSETHNDPLINTNLQQKVLNAATVITAGILATMNPKAALVSSLFSLFAQTNALASFNENSLDAALSREIKKTDVTARNELARQSAPITVVAPLPNLIATPGLPFSQQLSMHTFFKLSNPNANLELSIKQSNGTQAPSWLSMNMGDPSLIKFLGESCIDVFVFDKYAYIVGDGNFQIFDVTNPTNPTKLNSILPSHNMTFFQDVLVKGNEAFIKVYDILGGRESGDYWGIEVYDVTNPSNISLISSSNFFNTSTVYDWDLVGNHIYYIGNNNEDSPVMTILDISNSSNLILTSSTNLQFLIGFNLYGSITVQDNYAYIGNHQNLNNGLACLIYDVTDPSKPKYLSTLPYGGFGSAIQDNALFVAMNNQFGFSYIYSYDVTDKTNPELRGMMFIGYRLDPEALHSLSIQGNYLYVYCSTQGLKILNIEQGINTLTPVSFTTPANPFKGVINQNNLFVVGSGLSIVNTQLRKLSGTPGIADRGFWMIDVTVSDGLGNAIVEPMVIRVGDVNVTSITPQQLSIGNTAKLILDEGTFEYPGATYTFSANLIGGLPLPSFITFDPRTLTFTFAPKSGDQNIYPIEVTGNDGHDGTKSTTFDLTVLGVSPPIVANSLANVVATVDQPFVYPIPANTFYDPNNLPLFLTVLQSNGKPIPDWLKWDPIQESLSGTPGPWDTDVFQARTISIVIRASNGPTSVTSPFDIIVGGDSFFATFIKTGASLGSAAGVGYGLWNNRANVWNYFRKDKYRKGTERAIIGMEFNHKLSLNFKEVKEIKSFHNDKPMAHFPDGLDYKNGNICGVPAKDSEGRYTIRVFDQEGYIDEEFNLIIKNNEYDPDPPIAQTNFQTIVRKLKKPLKKNDMEEGGNRNSMMSALIVSDEDKV